MKILIADTFPDSVLNHFSRDGHEVLYFPEAGLEIYTDKIRDCEVLLLNSSIPIDQTFLSFAPRLKLILRAGIGLDLMDIEAIEKRGIQVINTPGANAQAVGEMCLGVLLNLLRNIRRADREVREFIWQREANRGTELSRLCLGIIGYGNTGKAFARCASGTGCKIIAYDKYAPPVQDPYAEACSLSELQNQADIVSFHIPLNAETFHMGNVAFFSAFSKPFYLLNFSRGGVVSLQDVNNLLESGKISGAGLDVLEQENFSKLSPEQIELYKDLFQKENVLLSPHIGGWTFTSKENIHAKICGAFDAWILELSGR